MTVIVSMTDLKNLPEAITEVVATGKPIHIPKGWTEQSGGVHLGRGKWMLRLKRTTPDLDRIDYPDPERR